MDKEELAQVNLDSFNGFITFFTAAFVLAFYLLMALGLYAQAKRNNVKNPWMAWVPIFQIYLLGELIGDKVWGFGYAKWILPLGQLLMVILVGFMPNTQLLAWLKVILGVVYFVYYLCALNRYYTLFDPDKSFLYLFLSIMFPITIPIWVFALRKNEKRIPGQYYYHEHQDS